MQKLLRISFCFLLLFLEGVNSQTYKEDIQQVVNPSSTLQHLLDSYAYSQTCFKNGEKIDQISKICYYKCTCGKKALNIKSYELCPLQEKFDC